VGLAVVGNAGARLAGGAEGGGDTGDFSSAQASTGVTGAVDAGALPYNEAAVVAGFAAPNIGRGAEGGGGGLAANGTDGVGVARSAAMSTFPIGW
jgi:hypothetical protein